MNPQHSHPASSLLPVGTAVVTRVDMRGAHQEMIRIAGSVGIVSHAPLDAAHPYRVRFPGGDEVSIKRCDLFVLKQFQNPEEEDPSNPMMEYDLHQHVIYRCLIGSRAYGLDHEGSDYDRRGIYLPPAAMQWSLFGIPEQLENEATQECYWELGKFLGLALKANPNVLEVLHSPVVEHATPLARELLDMRGIFLSRLVYQTYNGYVLSQFKKLETDLRNQGQIKWKHAMHLVRLLLAGIMILEEGVVQVKVEQHRDRLLAIRNGVQSWEEVNAWRLELHQRFDQAFAKTTLPDRPDYQAANAFLIKARRSMV